MWDGGKNSGCVAMFGHALPDLVSTCQVVIRSLVPLAINAVMAQLARTLIFVPISLCLNLMSAFFFVIYYYYYY